MEAAGKDQDPDYNLRRELVGNLGDDVIVYQKAPQNPTPVTLDSPPTLYLLGSPNPERLNSALRVLLSLLMPQQGGVKERDFLGRKIYSLAVTPLVTEGAAQARGLHLSASGDYLAASSDLPVLEEYLRSSGGGTAGSLQETAGLAEAAQRVGGNTLGIFGFTNQREEMRSRMEAAQKHPGSEVSVFGSIPIAGALGLSFKNSPASRWADVSLLPPFETTAKYFHYSVYAASFNTDGIVVNSFTPTPPQLR
jgi:hypothetical protein